jgi:hypothetical protein
MPEKYSFTYSVASFFVMLGLLFIPFPFHLIIFQQEVVEFIFGGLIRVMAHSVFGAPLKMAGVHSDSVSMYILVLLLFGLAVLISILLRYIKKWKQYNGRFFYIIYTIAGYYLILILLKYGLDKVFKTQFYLPEPNILYTPVGQLDKDILYWSSMGTSRLYNIFTGSIEVLASMLLFFRRTRMAGVLLAIVAMAEVTMINFGFDISVKLYSLFLLFISLYLLHPFYRRLFQVFFTPFKMIGPAAQPPSAVVHPFWKVFLKCTVTGFILLEGFYPYFKASNFNDDITERPYLHGAYGVTQMIAGTDTLVNSDLLIKRFFIHRNGYIIFQDQQDRMRDYKFDYDAATNKYTLTDYQLKTTKLDAWYNERDSMLTIKYLKDDQPVQLRGKALNWRKLPVLQKSFHWTVDGE